MNRPNKAHFALSVAAALVICIATMSATTNYVKETYRHIFSSLIDSTDIGQTTPGLVTGTTGSFAALSVANSPVCTQAAKCGANDQRWTFTSCATVLGQPSQCSGSTTLPALMPDASYQLFCEANSGSDPSDELVSIHQDPLPTTAGATINYNLVKVMQNGAGGGTTFTIYCWAHHD